MTIQIDVVLDLSRGDSGKGKVSHYLAGLFQTTVSEIVRQNLER
jgi:adenylosuccinate synthase